jgi:hypothetical protein
MVKEAVIIIDPENHRELIAKFLNGLQGLRFGDEGLQVVGDVCAPLGRTIDPETCKQ